MLQACPVTCGSGIHSRSRTVTSPWASTSPCPDTTSESIACNTDTCVTNCLVTDWGAWGSCGSDCASGNSTRSRNVMEYPGPNGAACPALNQSTRCGSLTGVTCTDCTMGAWTSWGSCSATCLSSLSCAQTDSNDCLTETHRRTRTLTDATGIGLPCAGVSYDTNTADTKACTSCSATVTAACLSECNPTVLLTSSSAANAARSASIVVTISGQGFGYIDRSVTAKVGTTSCTSSQWLSYTSLVCIAPQPLDYLSVGVGASVGTNTVSFIYDSPVITDYSTYNTPPSGGTPLSVQGKLVVHSAAHLHE